MSSLKRITAWTLFLAVLLQTSGMLLFVISFHTNRAYIARELCMNRNRPELQCNGRCILMQGIKKRLAQTDKKAAEHLQVVFEQSVVGVFETAQPFTLSASFLSERLAATAFYYLMPVSRLAVPTLFHPPAA